MNRHNHIDNSDSVSRSSGSLASQQAVEMANGAGHQLQQQQQHNHNQRHSAHGARQADESRPHRLDLYSVPVFILEVLVLAALAFVAYYLHYEYYIEPFVFGFYCDDSSLGHKFAKSEFTEQFIKHDHELTVLCLLIAVPITMVSFRLQWLARSTNHLYTYVHIYI